VGAGVKIKTRRRKKGWNDYEVLPMNGKGSLLIIETRYTLEWVFARKEDRETVWIISFFQHPAISRSYQRWLLRAVKSKQNFKPTLCFCRYPIRAFTFRRLRTEINIYRAIRIFLKIGTLRRTTCMRDISDETMRCAIIERGGPVLRNRGIRWHV